VLKITITDWPDEQRWSVQGRLVGRWAVELRSAWREPRRGGDTRRCVIELVGVTFIDRSGEDVLAEIMSHGAEFVANDVYIKHLLGNLRSELRPPRAREKLRSILTVTIADFGPTVSQLRDVEELSTEQAANALALSSSAMKIRLRRALSIARVVEQVLQGWRYKGESERRLAQEQGQRGLLAISNIGSPAGIRRAGLMREIRIARILVACSH